MPRATGKADRPRSSSKRPEADSSVDPSELAKFSAAAAEWWDPAGQFGPLHQLNPTRLAFIRDRVAAHFDRDHLADEPLKGLRVLDVGCGGGLLCEPLSRLGGRLTGIDATAAAVKAARVHASELGLTIDYRYTTAKVLAQTGEKFDVVLAMEVVEHAADVNAFVGSCSDLVKPGGAIILATLNRTAKAFLFAVLGAEYVLRWLPRGTHDWRRFVRPSELAAALRAHRVTVATISGVVYNPLTDRWQLSRDVSVNYMVFAVKPA